MKPAKVLYYYSSTHVDTGSPRVMLRMIDALDRSAYEPVFLANGEGTLVEELRARDVAIVPGRVDSLSWRHPVRALRRVAAKRDLLGNAGVDLVHMNEPGWNSDLVLAARMLRIPVALHIHNVATVARHNLNYRLASRVFICSAAQRRDITHVERIADRCVVLYNAVDLDAFAAGRPIRSEIGLAPDDIAIGTIAQIRHGKGLDIFLDAAVRLLRDGRKVKLVVAGPKAVGEDAFFEQFTARIGEHPLREHVIYLGSRRDVPDILASLDIFCLPTRGETFGMVVIEAMAAGVPVVTSRVGGIPEIIPDRDVGRTVADLTPKAFADAIDELLDSEDARKALGERGRRSLRGRFDLDSMGIRLGATYDAMLGKAAPGGADNRRVRHGEASRTAF